MRVFVPFALAYLFATLLRVVNAVIAPNLRADLGLSAGQLGFLTSALFLSFAAAQLPLGVFLDRYGPARVQRLMLLVTATGAVGFGFGRDTAELALARIVIGAGTAAGLMAGMKAAVLWFPPRRLPVFNGGMMAAGSIGAIIATAPVELALHYVHWPAVYWGAGAGCALVAVLIALMVPPLPETPGTVGHGTLREQLGGVLEVLRARRFWRLAPLTAFSQAAFLASQGLWAGPWLGDVAHLSREAVARALLLMSVSMVCGFLGFGALAGRLSARRHGVTALSIAGMASFVVPQLALLAPQPVPALALWMAFGFLGTTGILPYAALAHAFPPALAGRVLTSLNVLVFVAAFAVQWGMGSVIGHWPIAGGYAAQGYRIAFGAVAGLQLLGLAWFALLREPARRAG